MTHGRHGGVVVLPEHPDGPADVLVIAAWRGVRGFQARVTYAVGADRQERSSLVLLGSDEVVDLVASWLRRVEEVTHPDPAAPPPAAPPPPT